MKCKQCDKEMVKCGFGSVGGLVGNARYECRNKDCKLFPEVEVDE